MDSARVAGPRLHAVSPALRQSTAETILGTRKLPTLSQRIGHHEADVVASVGVLTAGVAQPDDQPIDPGAAAEGAQELLLGGGGALVRGVLATRGAGLAD